MITIIPTNDKSLKKTFVGSKILVTSGNVAIMHKGLIAQNILSSHIQQLHFFSLASTQSNSKPTKMLAVKVEVVCLLTCGVHVVGIGVVAKYRVKINIKALRVLWLLLRGGGCEPW